MSAAAGRPDRRGRRRSVGTGGQHGVPSFQALAAGPEPITARRARPPEDARASRRKQCMSTIEITDTNFENDVLQSNAPVLIDFWAEWCGPCKMISPIVEEVASEYTGRVKVGKVNVDHSPQVASKYGIRSIPTLLLFKDGEEKHRLVGAVPNVKAEISKMVDSVL
jgi:thioredoxin 1